MGDAQDAEDAGDELALIGEGDLHPADNDADDPPPCPSCGEASDTGTRGNPAVFVKQGRDLGLLDVDWRRLLPDVTFYCHLPQQNLTPHAQGVARIEGLGAVTVQQLREFLGDDTPDQGPAGRCHVGRIHLTRVVDIAGQTPVDSYETPDPMRDAMHLRNPGEVFPFSPYLGRKVQLDHNQPYLSPDDGGPPGQTHPDNLGPLRTLPHRLKTHGRWRIRNAGNGVYLWRSGYSHYYQVDATGTHRLTRQAGKAWWNTLTRTDTPERTADFVDAPCIELDFQDEDTG